MSVQRIAHACKRESGCPEIQAETTIRYCNETHSFPDQSEYRGIVNSMIVKFFIKSICYCGCFRFEGNFEFVAQTKIEEFIIFSLRKLVFHFTLSTFIFQKKSTHTHAESDGGVRKRYLQLTYVFGAFLSISLAKGRVNRKRERLTQSERAVLIPIKKAGYETIRIFN